MRCQSEVNCNSQVCWRQGNSQELWLQKEEEDDGFDGCLEERQIYVRYMIDRSEQT